jgi:hypothetical protein
VTVINGKESPLRARPVAATDRADAALASEESIVLGLGDTPLAELSLPSSVGSYLATVDAVGCQLTIGADSERLEWKVEVAVPTASQGFGVHADVPP